MDRAAPLLLVCLAFAEARAVPPVNPVGFKPSSPPSALPADSMADPLVAARQRLAEGDFDGAFELARPLPAERGREGALLLGELAEAALRAGDRGLAGIGCERALRLHAGETRALRVCAGLALADGRADDAARHAVKWMEVAPADDEAKVLAAEAAAALGEWGRVHALLDGSRFLSGPEARAKPLRAQARAILAEEAVERERMARLLSRLDRAVAEARALDRRPVEGSESGAVILYTTAWCGPCQQARVWLGKRRVAYLERDLEKEPAAQAELAAKCARAGIRGNGVPVLDVGGRLLVGFDPGAWSEALR